MNIIKLEVPENVRYISDWEEYKIPEGHCIVDKDICGCGYTEYCIRPENPFNTILCSPRIVLLENKMDQHPGEENLYYFQNQGVKKQFMNELGIKQETKIDKNHNLEFLEYASDQIRNHYNKCMISNQPCRILCTYDSFYHIKRALKDKLQNFRVIVDEFQVIFTDSFFKPEVEAEFLRTLSDVPNVTFLSATPMLERYLEKMDEFRDLPYYRMIWGKDKTIEATVHEKWVSNVESEALKIIKIYKKGLTNRPWKDIEGTLIYSNEVVFYINSVASIRRIIKKAGLLPSECNIICAKTKQNLRDIRKMPSPDPDEIFDIGKVPGKTSPRKMFTFCTKTTYLGADFYSDNAYTVVLSDANIQSLAVDVRLDLPQILGRQRLLENPWKNECIVFYKTTRIAEETDWTEEEFRDHIMIKEHDTLKMIECYDGVRDKEVFIKNNVLAGEGDVGRIGYYLSLDSNGKPVINNLMKLAEERAWEMTRKEYRTRVNVLQSIGDTKYTKVDTYLTTEDVRFKAFYEQFKKLTTFDSRLELYCEFREKFKDDVDLTIKVQKCLKSYPFENYYSHFGIKTCRAVGYRAAELKKRLLDETHGTELKSIIYSTFSLNTRYSLKDIKLCLSSIYSRLGIKKTAKASDLLDYYNINNVIIYDPTTKKRSAGYELISIK